MKNKEAIVDAISLELSLKSNGFSETIDSIYFGGGTPSLLDINDFALNFDNNIKISCVNIGNPHAVLITNKDVDEFDFVD